MASRIRVVTLLWLMLSSKAAVVQAGGGATPRAAFNEARLGMSIEAWKQIEGGALAARHPCHAIAKPSRTIGDTGCYGFQVETLDGVPVLASSFTFVAGELATIGLLFRSEQFVTAAAALEERFGPPRSKENPTVQTRLGATYVNDVRLWVIGTDAIEARKYSVHISDAYIQYRSQKALTERDARAKQRAGDGKKDP